MKQLVTIISIVIVGAVVLGAWLYTNSKQPPTSDAGTVFLASTVAIHNTKEDCWTIIRGSVYDLSTYVNRHPGGSEIERACGQDATSLFTTRSTSSGEIVGSGSPHSSVAEAQLEKLKIGTLKE